MRFPLAKKVLVSSLVALAAGLVIASGPALSGQDAKEKKKGRLPAYYGDIVNDAQRQQIYAVQEKYAKTLAALQDQIDTIEKQRDTEIEALLDAQQKTKLAAARQAVAEKKAKAAVEKAQQKAAEAKAAAEKAK